MGRDSVKCDRCGNAVKPFEIVHGYTVTFDDTHEVGLTLPSAASRANHSLHCPTKAANTRLGAMHGSRM